MTVAEQRSIPTLEEAARQIEQGLIDDSILHLTDDELREQLAPYRRDRRDDEDSSRRSA